MPMIESKKRIRINSKTIHVERKTKFRRWNRKMKCDDGDYTLNGSSQVISSEFMFILIANSAIQFNTVFIAVCMPDGCQYTI